MSNTKHLKELAKTLSMDIGGAIDKFQKNNKDFNKLNANDVKRLGIYALEITTAVVISNISCDQEERISITKQFNQDLIMMAEHEFTDEEVE